jgi:hypothetical protein
MEQASQELFFDPFAENGGELFDATQTFDRLFERYAAGQVEHDYTADKFVADTEALLLDAQFVGQFEQAQNIVAMMQKLCAHDHALEQTLAESVLFSAKSHDHDDHNHTPHESGQDDDEKNKKKKKKGWFGMVLWMS